MVMVVLITPLRTTMVIMGDDVKLNIERPCCFPDRCMFSIRQLSNVYFENINIDSTKHETMYGGTIKVEKGGCGYG